MKGRILSVVLLAVVVLCGFDSRQQKIYDEAGLLSSGDREELQGMLVAAAGDAQQDMVIVTTDDSGGKSAMEYADDFYDDHGFGYEKTNGSGVLFLIDMDNREIYISTAGTAMAEYTDAEIDETLDAVYPHVKSQDYGEACRVFVEEARMALMGSDRAQNSHYDSETGRFVSVSPWKKALTPGRLALYFILALVLSGFTVYCIAGKRKTRMTAGGNTYLKDGGLDLHLQSDRYVHTTVVTRQIPRNTGGGGASGGFHSSHTSSGGHSHGGGGRSF